MSGTLDFIIRTEDIIPEEILGLFVPTDRDLELIEILKSPSPVVLEGSRGTGKSFLLKVCEQQQISSFEQDRIFPVYVSFARSSLINTADPQQFMHWMLARLCSRIVRSLYQQGIIVRPSQAFSSLAGEPQGNTNQATKIEAIADLYESSYKNPKTEIDISSIPDIETFKDAIDDLRRELNIKRFNILFDEAAHIFRPEQQRQFFTLFRDLRSPYITCNAAVYPGVTSYGPSFEMMHDGRLESLQRSILSKNYLSEMRDIVFKQASSELQSDIERNSENFNALAYAANGNPRLLLKTVAQAPKLNASQTRDVLKKFFREDIWSEHSNLAEKFPGHKAMVDWGRTFIEQTVIIDTNVKNETRKSSSSTRTCFFWVHRDAPAAVQEALRLLMYVGIINDMGSGIVATRAEIGARYSVNIGCLAAPSSAPVAFITDLCAGLDIRRMTEYGANLPSFIKLQSDVGKITETDLSETLNNLFSQPVTVLDLSHHLRSSLISVGIDTVGKAFSSSEVDFRKANYIGPVRSRKIMNVTTSAVLEYLSG